MKKLNKTHILLLHKQLIEEFGGIHGIRDEGLLDLSINSIFQTFDNKDLYSSILEKAAHLGFSLIRNHPFIDGNKRIGIHAMLVFLAVNNYYLNYTQEELIEIVLNIASSKATDTDLLEWIRDHLQ